MTLDIALNCEIDLNPDLLIRKMVDSIQRLTEGYMIYVNEPVSCVLF